ncbi:NADP-dependent malic enzyme [Candidatus Woesebacteria bacterium]|nr:NADP-dependent malic enzyme [Candidatus Woesebacteria bacterium]
MTDIAQQSIQLHKEKQGKLEVSSRVNIENSHDLSLAYTPGVGAVSREIAKNSELSRELTLNGRTVAIISDGTAVLGLGDIGPYAALPVMEGKALLIKKFAGIDSFPLVIDTKEPSEVIKFVKWVAPTFSAINLEDIKAPNCFQVEEALQDLGIPVFHDDQHGTAIVVAAALRNAAKVVQKPYESLRVGIVGAGAAGLAIAKMLLGANCRAESCSYVDNLPRVADVVVFDSQGALYKGRPGMNVYKQAVAGISNHDSVQGNPEQALAGFDVVVGVSGPGTISSELIKNMAEKSIVFAMANPDPEIMPDAAKLAGAYVVATGRSDFANQINNVLAFPAIFKIAHELKLKQITMEVKIALVDALASLVTDPKQDEVIVSPFYPNLVETLVQKVIAKLS